MKELIAITAKHWLAITVITILTAASCVVFGINFNKTAYDTTVFINVGAKANPAISPLDTAQAADGFTETIVGWFKNPVIISNITSESGTAAALSARRQEKQNLVVTFKTQTEDQAKKISQAIEKAIKAEIDKYNAATAGGFMITDFSAGTEENNVNLALFALLGLAAGLMLGGFLTAFFDRIMKNSHEHRD